MKPVNTEALSKWVGQIPPDVVNDMAEIAPMLARLGYNPHANPPDYTKTEPLAPEFNYSHVSLKALKVFLPLRHPNPNMMNLPYETVERDFIVPPKGHADEQ